MTGVVFAFAFIGALAIGFVAGVLVMKYSRFSCRKDNIKALGEITEQLRVFSDTLRQRNDLLDREEKNIQAAVNQADFLPPWYRHWNDIYSDRLHPQSVPVQIYYQDWATLLAAAALYSSRQLFDYLMSSITADSTLS